MNTYKDHLDERINKILSKLSTEEQKLSTAANCADLNLYYSEGGKITALEKLNQAIENYESAAAARRGKKRQSRVEPPCFRRGNREERQDGSDEYRRHGRKRSGSQ